MRKGLLFAKRTPLREKESFAHFRVTPTKYIHMGRNDLVPLDRVWLTLNHLIVYKTSKAEIFT